MTKSLLLIRASARAGLRWAKEHVYSWLILGPVVLGISYFTAWRLAGDLPEWETSPPLAVAVATLFEISLIALSLSRTSGEIYHLRRPESYFDALPIPVSSHLHAALATRTLKTLVIAIAAAIARLTFGEAESLKTLDLLLLSCFVAITSLSQALAALNWIHWGHRRNSRAALAAVLVLTISATLAGFVLALVLKPAYFTPAFKLWLIVSCTVGIVLLYSLDNRLHRKWRSSDLEYAKRLQSAHRSTELITRAVRRRLSQIVAAQVARDVQLTLRAFSSAVYVVFAVAAIWTVAMAVALVTDFLPQAPPSSGWLDATWLPQVMAVKITCVLAVASLASLLPVLIAYELPHMWLERAAGTTGLDIWQAKLWYARLVAIPAPLAVCFAGAMTDTVPAFYALPLLAECLWLWWMVSSLMGALSFEMPTRPELAIIVTGTLGFAMGLLGSLLWPVGLIAYPQVMHSLTARGRHRTRYYLITEDE
ncbi:MAG: hypothetical protein AABN33_26105 [Acidobacteriota bacterium]